MKKLQNNFTTPEQSKRLLELGVPAWTADCYYYEEGGISKECAPNVVPLGEVWTDESKETMFSSYVDVPCWSVCRLIEIRDICAKYRITHADFMGNYIENIIMSFYAIHATNGFDFSKLEE